MKFAERVCRIYSLSGRETANSLPFFSEQFCHTRGCHSVYLQIDPICIASENLTTVNFTGKFSLFRILFSISVTLHVMQDIPVLVNNKFDVTDTMLFFVNNHIIFYILFFFTVVFIAKEIFDTFLIQGS